MPSTRRCLMAIAFAMCAPASPASASDLVDLMPVDTLLYVGWPGAGTFKEASADTAFAHLLAEPQVEASLGRLRREIWPAIQRALADETGSGDVPKVFADLLQLGLSMWEYPTAFSFVGVGMGEEGPEIDLALVIRAGRRADHVARQMDGLIATLNPPAEMIREVDVGGITLNQLSLPNFDVPIRWGVIKDDVLITLGRRVTEFAAVAEGPRPRPTLRENDGFTASIVATGASNLTPMVYLDVEGLLQTFDDLQPLFAAMDIPILGRAGGLRSVAEAAGLDGVEAMASVIQPMANGFRTATYLHAPTTMGQVGRWMEPTGGPITDIDLKAVPANACWARVGRLELANFYQGVLMVLSRLDVQTHEAVLANIEQIEAKAGVRVQEDLLQSFGDTWAAYDAADSGGLWFTGLTLVAKVEDGPKLDYVPQRLVEAVAEVWGVQDSIELKVENHRGQKITWLSIQGLPVPVAPAWARYEKYWIAGLYPQMVRDAMDHLMDDGMSIVANEDFIRGRKLMPTDSHAVGYLDTAEEMRGFYRLVLPVFRMFAGMAQDEGLPVDIGLMPSLPVLLRHQFGTVSATSTTEQGWLQVTHAPTPFSPATGTGALAIMLGSTLGLTSMDAIEFVATQPAASMPATVPASQPAESP